MKKLIILAIFLLFFPVVSHADCTVVVGGVAASGYTAILEETFETDEYDNVTCGSAPCVTELASTPNGNQDTTDLDMTGDKCLHLDTGEYVRFLHAAQDKTPIYYLLKWRYSDAMEANEEIYEFYNSNSQYSGSVLFNYTDTKLYAVTSGGDNSVSGTATTIAAGASTFIKCKVTEGTDADTEVCVATWNGSSWDSYVCSSNGTAYYDITGIRLQNEQDGALEESYFDNLIIGNTDFTNAPTTY